MNTKHEQKTGYNGMWVMIAVLLCSSLAYAGFQTWELSDVGSPRLRSTKIITLQHKINSLESRISDIESGDYYRRIAALTGKEITSDAVQTFIISNKLDGSLAEKKNELEKLRVLLAKLTNKKVVPTSASEESESTRVASLAAHLDN
jgi:uncharacterized coiled-coil protein SlyX